MNNPTPKEIRKARKEAGLTQKQAGALIGRTDHAWRKYENGQNKMDGAHFDYFKIKTAERMK